MNLGCQNGSYLAYVALTALLTISLTTLLTLFVIVSTALDEFALDEFAAS